MSELLSTTYMCNVHLGCRYGASQFLNVPTDDGIEAPPRAEKDTRTHTENIMKKERKKKPRRLR
jgi:hypothetical protein